MDQIERVEQAGIMPVVRLENVDDAVPMAQALRSRSASHIRPRTGTGRLCCAMTAAAISADGMNSMP